MKLRLRLPLFGFLSPFGKITHFSTSQKSVVYGSSEIQIFDKSDTVMPISGWGWGKTWTRWAGEQEAGLCIRRGEYVPECWELPWSPTNPVWRQLLLSPWQQWLPALAHGRQAGGGSTLLWLDWGRRSALPLGRYPLSRPPSMTQLLASVPARAARRTTEDYGWSSSLGEDFWGTFCWRSAQWCACYDGVQHDGAWDSSMQHLVLPAPHLCGLCGRMRGHNDVPTIRGHTNTLPPFDKRGHNSKPVTLRNNRGRDTFEYTAKYCYEYQDLKFDRKTPEEFLLGLRFFRGNRHRTRICIGVVMSKMMPSGFTSFDLCL